MIDWREYWKCIRKQEIDGPPFGEFDIISKRIDQQQVQVEVICRLVSFV